MKCLNCDSSEADEINVSVNISRTDGDDYTGDTDYGDNLIPIGTFCTDCAGSWAYGESFMIEYLPALKTLGFIESDWTPNDPKA